MCSVEHNLNLTIWIKLRTMRETVRALVVNNKKEIFFVQHNEQDPKNLGKWSTIGGGLDSGETYIECLFREIEEEFGYVSAQNIKIGTKLLKNEYYGRIDHFYAAFYKGKNLIPIVTEEIISSQWFTHEEVLKLNTFFGFEKKLAKEALKYFQKSLDSV